MSCWRAAKGLTRVWGTSGTVGGGQGLRRPLRRKLLSCLGLAQNQGGRLRRREVDAPVMGHRNGRPRRARAYRYTRSLKEQASPNFIAFESKRFG
jgi:hypothetical protein